MLLSSPGTALMNLVGKKDGHVWIKSKHLAGRRNVPLDARVLGPLMFRKCVLHLASIPLFNPPH